MNKDNIHGFFWVPPIEQNAVGHIMDEVYKLGLFEPFRPEKKESSVCIDVGGNIGITSYYFSSRFETTYVIEPAKEHMDVLKYMLEFNKIKNVKPFQFALSRIDKESEKFWHYSNKTMYSLYPNIVENGGTGGLARTGSENVQLKRIDTFMKEQNIEHVNLLKLDCEGVEFEILGSEGFKNVAHKIDTIVGEVHGYSGRNPNQIKDSLEGNGFKFQIVPHEAALFVATR